MAASAIFCLPVRRDSGLWILDDVDNHVAQHTPFALPTATADKSSLANCLIPPAPPPYADAPPAYEDALSDLPPDYSGTDARASAKCTLPSLELSIVVHQKDRTAFFMPDLSHKPQFDWANTDGMRSHVSKKQKQAAKKAAQARWMDDDDDGDGSKDGGDQNGDNGSNGGGGGSNGGAGGGDGGDDGDDKNPWDDNDWNDAGSKKKKKGKKSKAQEEEEEEQEKKDAEVAGTSTTGNFWDNLGDLGTPDEANPDDEWGIATSGKKNKKATNNKKAKEPTPPPPTSAPANFSMDSTFDDITLDAPKIDLSFGGNDSKGNDLSFGNWGSAWGFTGLGGGGTDKSAANAGMDTMDSSDMWNLGTGKKDSKKKTTKKSTGFDFSFNDDFTAEDPLADSKKDDDDPLAGFTTATTKPKKSKKTIGFAALDDIAPDPVPATDLGDFGDNKDGSNATNPWNVTSKKDKKATKKTAVEDIPPPPPPPPPPTEPEPDDLWAPVTNKKDKKKKKDDAITPVKEEPLVVVVPEPDPAEDIWSTMPGKKDKKKKKDDVITPAKEEPPVVVVPEAEPEDMWSSFTTKKDKKKSKKDEAVSPFKEEPPPPPPPPPAEPEPDDFWSSLTTKKDKKKKKDEVTTPAKEEPPVVVVPEPDAEANGDDSWDFFGTGKKDKKKKKAVKDEPEPVVVVPDASRDIGLAESTTKKDKTTEKEKKKIGTNPFDAFDHLTSNDTPGDDNWTWGTVPSKTDKKKSKKGAAEEQDFLPAAPEPPANDAQEEDDWMSSNVWATSTGKKDKKTTKKSKAAEADPLPADKSMDLDTFNMDGDDDFDWSAALDTGKKDKKKKDTKTKDITGDDPMSLSLLQQDSVPDNTMPSEDDPWSWGNIMKKDGKKKSKKDVPPPVPEPRNLGLTPGSSPPPDEKNEFDNVDDLNLDDWITPVNDTAKAKKDVKKSTTTGSSKITKVEDTKTDSKADKKSKTTPVDDDILAILEAPKDESKPLSKTSSKDEASPKASKSFWGSLTGGSTSTKSKAAKEMEKEKKEREEAEKAQKEQEEADAAQKEIEEAAALASKKDAKKKGTSSTATKDDAKASKKPKAEFVPLDFPEEEEAAATIEPASPPVEDKKPSSKKSDAWGFWGATPSSAREKEKEIKKPAVKTTKEIANESSTNQKDALAEKPPTSNPTDAALKTTTSAAKGKPAEDTPVSPEKDKEKDKDKEKEKRSTSFAKSSFADKSKEKKTVEFQAPLSPPLEPETKAASKVESKGSTVTRKPVKGKAVEPEAEKEPTPLPGGFPLDDNAELLTGEPPEMVSTKKSDKTSKKLDKKDKTIQELDPIVMDVVSPPASPPAEEPKKKSSSESKKKSTKVVEPVKPPTPPPEPETTATLDAKSSKAEKKRTEGSSWSFFGSSTKPTSDSERKDRKSKDDSETVSPQKAKDDLPALTRSKSERKPSVRDVEKSAGSGSDNAKATESRPSKSSKASGLAAFFGTAPPPSRSGSKRHSVAGTKSTSRGVELPSPPLEEEEEETPIPDKAAKMERRKSLPARSQSMREKSKKSSALDFDENMDGPELVDPPRKDSNTKSSGSKSRGAKTRMETSDDLGDTRKSKDQTSEEKRSRPVMKRSASSAKKSEGLIGGLFGGVRKKEARPSNDDEVDAKRLRRESRKLQRPANDAEGEAVKTDVDAEAAEARRAERRKRRSERETREKEERDAELAEQAEQDARQRERERAKADERRELRKDRARQREEEDRRARKARDDERAAQEAADQEAADRRRRRRERPTLDVEAAREARPRHSDRRRSYQPEMKRSPHPDDDEYGRRGSNRSRKTLGPSPLEASKSYRRKSGIAEDYFAPRGIYANDRRNSISRSPTDKTASWVHMVNTEPPPPPPVAETVIEAEPEYTPISRIKSSSRREPRRSEYRKDRERERRSDEDSSGHKKSDHYDDPRGSGQKGAAGWLRKMVL